MGTLSRLTSMPASEISYRLRERVRFHDGRHTAISNAVFDTSLRERNPEWGVRDIEDLQTLAGSVGLALIEVAEMPANNLILVFERPKTA